MPEPWHNPFAHLTEYELYHLAEHLADSWRPHELYRLFALETDEQRNAWYEEGVLYRGDLREYTSAVEAAWSAAERHSRIGVSHGELAPTIGLESRYTLLLASLNSIADKIPPSLLMALVRQGIWTPSQAEAYISQRGDVAERAMMLAALSQYYPGELPPSAHTTAETADTIVHSLQGIRDAVRLAPLALEIRQELANLSTAGIEKLGWPSAISSRIRVLVKAIPKEFKGGVGQSHWSTRVPTKIARIFRSALAIAGRLLGRRSLEYGWRAVAALGLPKPGREDELREIWEHVRSVKSELVQFQFLELLAPHLPSDLLPDALRIAVEMKSKWIRAFTLGTLGAVLPKIPYSILQDKLTEFTVIGDGEHRLKALKAYEHRLRDLGSPKQGQGLANLAHAISESARPETPYSVPGVTCPVVCEQNRSELQAGSNGDLPNILLQQACMIGHALLDTAEAVPGASYNLRYQLSEPSWNDAFKQATTIARYIENEEEQTATAVGLASLTTGAECFESALAMVRAIGSDYCTTRVLTVLASNLPRELLNEALRIAHRIHDKQMRVEALVSVAVRMAEVGHHQDALEIAMSQRRVSFLYASPRRQIYEAIIPHLSEALLKDVLKDLENVWWNQRDVILILQAMAPHFSTRSLVIEAEEVIRSNLGIWDKPVGAEAMGVLVPYLSSTQRAEFLQEILETSVIEDQIEQLNALAPYLISLPSFELYSLWQTTLHRMSVHRRSDVLRYLVALAPVVETLGGPEAVIEVIYAIRDVGRWWP